MEMTFYDDSQFQVVKNDGKSLKRPVSLDLDSPNFASKKAKFNPVLTSPDLNMLKLRTPDIEKYILTNIGVTTPTPTHAQILFPSRNTTEAQEEYTRGFLDALNNLHQSVEINPGKQNSENSTTSNLLSKLYMPIYLAASPATASVIKSSGSPKNNVITTFNPSTVRPPSVESTNSSSCNSNSLPVPLEFSVKEELQTVPSDYSSPPVSPLPHKTPIDMADQERIKLERKRYRNRIAASKCRRRKLEKISQLEDKVKDLKGENAKLEAFADRLREQVCSLKQTVLDHVKKGCQIMVHQSL